MEEMDEELQERVLAEDQLDEDDDVFSLGDGDEGGFDDSIDSIIGDNQEDHMAEVEKVLREAGRRTPPSPMQCSPSTTAALSPVTAADMESTQARSKKKEDDIAISAKGISLTHKQLKLLGLDVSTTVALTKIHENRSKLRFDRMERLARPRPTTATSSEQRFASEDDARNCSFKWQRSRRAEVAMRNPGCGYDFVREKGGASTEDRESFIHRMDASLSHSRKRLQEKREEEEYERMLLCDKKACPRCSAVQSFDEIRKKKDFCGTCDLRYRVPHRWDRKRSENRVRALHEKTTNRWAELEARIQRELQGKDAQHRTKTQLILQEKVGKMPFIDRMSQDVEKRLDKVQQMAAASQEVDRNSFQPTLHSTRMRRAGRKAQSLAAMARAAQTWGGLEGKELERVNLGKFATLLETQPTSGQ